jgi:hypothetical protein
MRNEKLVPCAQVNVTMAPDIGRCRYMYLKEGVVDRAIMNNEMTVKMTCGGEAKVDTSHNLYTK